MAEKTENSEKTGIGMSLESAEQYMKSIETKIDKLNEEKRNMLKKFEEEQKNLQKKKRDFQRGTFQDIQRRERTRRLIANGGLFEIVGLGETDKGVLLGALLEIAKECENIESEKLLAWKRTGDKLLAEREVGKRQTAKKKSEVVTEQL